MQLADTKGCSLLIKWPARGELDCKVLAQQIAQATGYVLQDVMYLGQSWFSVRVSVVDATSCKHVVNVLRDDGRYATVELDSRKQAQ